MDWISCLCLDFADFCDQPDHPGGSRHTLLMGLATDDLLADLHPGILWGKLVFPPTIPDGLLCHQLCQCLDAREMAPVWHHNPNHHLFAALVHLLYDLP